MNPIDSIVEPIEADSFTAIRKRDAHAQRERDKLASSFEEWLRTNDYTFAITFAVAGIADSGFQQTDVVSRPASPMPATSLQLAA